jgi:hypothetical protein
MGPPLVFLFFNGVGLMQVLTPSNVYLVDASQTRSAEAVRVRRRIDNAIEADLSVYADCDQ